MRVCPKCGHVDPPIWKNQAHKLCSDYCHKDELEYFDASLLKNILECNPLTRGAFRYHLSKAGYVHRIALIDLCNSSHPKSMEEPDMEKPKNRYHPECKKLSEYV